jgi:hypothetical protein
VCVCIRSWGDRGEGKKLKKMSSLTPCVLIILHVSSCILLHTGICVLIIPHVCPHTYRYTHARYSLDALIEPSHSIPMFIFRFFFFAFFLLDFPPFVYKLAVLKELCCDSRQMFNASYYYICLSSYILLHCICVLIQERRAERAERLHRNVQRRQEGKLDPCRRRGPLILRRYLGAIKALSRRY